MNLKRQLPFDCAEGDCQTEWPPNFIGHNSSMTVSFISAVISTSGRGEISSNKRISPFVEMTEKWKSVIGSEVDIEVC